ncbi:MAG: alpha-glucosidase/alpha-galactosidase, partial [Candidatus Sumerlaeia bacterium]
MAKIVIIGAGSGFGGHLSIDIMAREFLRDSTICLCDIHEGRLKGIYEYVKRTAEYHKLPTKVVASTDRRDLLPDADFVVTSIAQGGGAYWGSPYREEVEIPAKYGIYQTVADTVSVGAVFRFLRTGPVQQQIFRDLEELCPDAWVLNHTNPMCMLSWLHCVDTQMRYAGLCHGVQGTTKELAKLIDVPYDEISFKVAGINHLAWILEFMRGKEDLYPKVWKLLEDPEKVKGEEVRFELMKNFGYFPTESNRHDAEYVPYFRKNESDRERFPIPPRHPVPMEPRKHREWMKDTGADGNEEKAVGQLKKSHEYTTGIMEAILTNVPYSFQGNVMNHGGLIENLPENCCVEVPCLVDARGIHPCYVGKLPTQCAALNRTNVNVHELAVEAVLNKDREAAFHACAVDPLTAAILPLDKIREMFEEMWTALEPHLKWFDPNHTGP